MQEHPFTHVNLNSWRINNGLLSRDTQEYAQGIFHFLTARYQNRQLVFTSLIGFGPVLPWPLYRIT